MKIESYPVKIVDWIMWYSYYITFFGICKYILAKFYQITLRDTEKSGYFKCAAHLNKKMTENRVMSLAENFRFDKMQASHLTGQTQMG